MVSDASARPFPDNRLSSFRKFSPEQLNLQGQQEVAISETSYPSLYQNVTEGKLMLFGKKFSNSSEFFLLECGRYPPITYVVEATNTLVEEKHYHNESFITVKVFRRTQNFEKYLAIERPGLPFFSTDLVHIFGSNVCNDFGVMLRKRRPHKP